MGAETGIEWTDATWNPVRGCTRVSPGCGGPGPHGGCYAEIMAARFSKSAYELTAAWLEANPSANPADMPAFKDQWGHGFAEMKGGDHRWTGKVALIDAMLTLPMRWKAPRKIFVNSTSDLFHESLSDNAIARVFATMALAPKHTYQILTKRPARMRDWLTSNWTYESVYNEMGRLGESGVTERHPFRTLYPNGMPWPMPNVWLGTSIEDQQRAHERLPLLLDTPACVRFVSVEPMLGPIDLVAADHNTGAQLSTLHWAICGGESGEGARPMHPDWTRALRDQCRDYGVPFFFKQWGEWHPNDHAIQGDTGHTRVGKKSAGRLLDGREHNGFPEVAA